MGQAIKEQKNHKYMYIMSHLLLHVYNDEWLMEGEDHAYEVVHCQYVSLCYSSVLQ